MSITIKKAKLKGRRLTLDYFRSVEGGSDTISVKCANQVHPDLLAAMDKLIPHFNFSGTVSVAEVLINEVVNAPKKARKKKVKHEELKEAVSEDIFDGSTQKESTSSENKVQHQYNLFN